jgi:hypothetical protein
MKKMSLVLLLSAVTTVMGMTENKNNSVHEHFLGLGCTATNQAQSLTYGGGVEYPCPVSTGSHSFTIRNPKGSLITYYSSDGANCDAILKRESAVYYQTYSNAEGTTSSSITVNGAPCNANPCCFVVLCFDLLNGCDLNIDYSWTATPAAISNILGTIIGAVVGVLVCLISGCIGYCRYRHTCCFKRKSISIPAHEMRRSDGTLIGVVGGAV